MKNSFLILMLAILSIPISAQEITGKWKTIDDNSGEARSIVEIYRVGSKFHGKVVKIYSKPGEDPDPICDVCEDDRKNQKVIGMEIIKDMGFNAKSKEYSGGEILDPESGSIYDCKIWIAEDGSLKVRGYLYFLYRTQTWYRFEE